MYALNENFESTYQLSALLGHSLEILKLKLKLNSICTFPANLITEKKQSLIVDPTMATSTM